MTATVRGLNHAVLYVRDARRAAAFYSEAFGFEVLADYPQTLQTACNVRARQ